MTQDRAWTTASIEAGAFEALAAGLPASEVWSLLLEVFARRAAERAPATLLQQWERDRFVQPALVDQRTFLALDTHLLAAAAAFEAIELSPLAPLGVCSAVGLASQHKIVSALRGTEVVSDPTNVLALECARRLRLKPVQTVRLATSHRCVRAQKAPNKPGFSQHFRIFCLASAAREQKDHATVTAALIEHIQTMMSALDRLEEHGYAFPDRRITVLATDARSVIGDRIAAALPRPNVVISRARLEHGYYHGLRYMINVRGPEGHDLPLIHGGAFDWLGRLTSNQKLVFVASGMGSQLAAFVFRTRLA
jgi:hypothetical protein